MLDYNTIFFAECQDGNGFLFHFINFAQTQVIFYSRLTSRDILFLLYMCSCFQSRSLRRKLCSISQLITFTKNSQELLPYIQKSRRGHLHNGKSPRRYSFIGYAAFPVCLFLLRRTIQYFSVPLPTPAFLLVPCDSPGKRISSWSVALRTPHPAPCPSAVFAA